MNCPSNSFSMDFKILNSFPEPKQQSHFMNITPPKLNSQTALTIIDPLENIEINPTMADERNLITTYEMTPAEEDVKENERSRTTKSGTPKTELSLDKVATVVQAESKSHLENPSTVYKVVGAASDDNVPLPVHMFSTTDQEDQPSLSTPHNRVETSPLECEKSRQKQKRNERREWKKKKKRKKDKKKRMLKSLDVDTSMSKTLFRDSDPVKQGFEGSRLIVFPAAMPEPSASLQYSPSQLSMDIHVKAEVTEIEELKLTKIQLVNDPPVPVTPSTKTLDDKHPNTYTLEEVQEIVENFREYIVDTLSFNLDHCRPHEYGGQYYTLDDNIFEAYYSITAHDWFDSDPKYFRSPPVIA
mmetsp:Transcript_27306/g.33066  ORF Transcript_27306/g.33066 Transcript_27306/m.33066 type:complete len:357 (+) Transcript_27306:352-1422(+)